MQTKEVFHCFVFSKELVTGINKVEIKVQFLMRQVILELIGVY